MGRNRSLVNQRKWAAKPPEQCQWSLACTARRTSFYYCAAHHRRVLESHTRTRVLRKRLGFCVYCLELAEPGYNKCPRHRASQTAAQRRWRERQKMARGWRLVSVPYS